MKLAWIHRYSEDLFVKRPDNCARNPYRPCRSCQTKLLEIQGLLFSRAKAVTALSSVPITGFVARSSTSNLAFAPKTRSKWHSPAEFILLLLSGRTFKNVSVSEPPRAVPFPPDRTHCSISHPFPRGLRGTGGPVRRWVGRTA